ncbi:MAG: ATP-binding cassette domain-containing protein [Steroidobacteraceae bacterium]
MPAATDPLLRLDDVSLAFGSLPLLHHASLQLEPGERVCVVGRNGAGKSSLMRLVRGLAPPDSGRLWIRPGSRVAALDQDIDEILDQDVAQVVAGGLPEIARLLKEWHEVIHAFGDDPSSEQLADRMSRLQQALDANDGWQVEQRVSTVLSHLGLDGDARYASLSGGWRRRVLLGRALVTRPELLLLDEPTNHLDVAAIEWLEEFLRDYSGALLFVSHDRRFVDSLATRIVDLDRGVLTSWPGNYTVYAERKAELMRNEAKENAEFDKRLAQEEVWIRKGVEARRTRNEGRVRALMAMRNERRARIDRVGRAGFRVQEANESAQLVFEAEGAAVRLGERTIFSGLETRILRGDRIGIVGPNGAGKSTLLKLILGELEPSEGTVRRGARLEVAYYDQQRAQLNLEASVMHNINDRSDHVVIGGESRHLSGYLREFLFRPDQLHTPAGALSGGERNRLLLARLFAQPANLLVMDEPTNDLDMDTLDLLQERIDEFKGTLLLVSHDRYFLDSVVTNLLVLDGSGGVQDFVGGYSDFQAWRAERSSKAAAATKTSRPAPSPTPVAKPAPPTRKRSNQEQRELAELPARLEALEKEKATLTAAMTAPDFYSRPGAEIAAEMERLAQIDARIDAAFTRWTELES